MKAKLKEDVAFVDAKIMGLSKRVDSVEKRLRAEIAEVRDELRTHRKNVELHAVSEKRVLKKVVWFNFGGSYDKRVYKPDSGNYE